MIAPSRPLLENADAASTIDESCCLWPDSTNGEEHIAGCFLALLT